MKVIETTNVSDWKCPCTCPECKSKLEADVSDLVYNKHSADGIYPSSETFNVTCPICNKQIFILGSSIPKLIKIKVINHHILMGINDIK